MPKLKRKAFRRALAELHIELVRWQGAIKVRGDRVLVIVEGRDAAGKGGAIKRLVEPLNPRGCRVVALDRPNDREKGQWYFQRYLQHLPAAGEIVVFDRSWYNRAGLERVNGYCTLAQYTSFLRAVPDLEAMLVRDGLTLRKLFLDVGKEEQARRLMKRQRDPLVQWKLSQLDEQAQAKWDDYTEAAKEMFARTATNEAPWTIVAADDKRRARLNALRWILGTVAYEGQRKDILAPDPGFVEIRP